MTEEAQTQAPADPKLEAARWRNRRRMAYISLGMLIFITVMAVMHPDRLAKVETLMLNLAYAFAFIVAVGYMGASTFQHLGKK